MHSYGLPDCKNTFISLVLGSSLVCYSQGQIFKKGEHKPVSIPRVHLDTKDLERQLRRLLDLSPEALHEGKAVQASPRIMS